MNWIVKMFAARERFHSKLREVKQDNPNAQQQGKKSCQGSGVCCWVSPPRLLQEDLERIAGHLGKSVESTFEEFCVVDTREGAEQTLLLARAGDSTGEWLDNMDTWNPSPCVFFNQELSKCNIYEARPKECREYKCWDEKKFESIEWSKDDLVQIGWNGIK